MWGPSPSREISAGGRSPEVRLSVEERQQAVAFLRMDAKMSQRDIAAVLGVDQKTVKADLDKVSIAQNCAMPAKVTTKDGKRSYPATRKPASKPRAAKADPGSPSSRR